MPRSWKISGRKKGVSRESCARLSPRRQRALQQLYIRSGIDIFDQALIAYERALTYVSRQQTPQSWAATLIDIGRANWELGIGAEGPSIAQYLSGAMKAHNQALAVCTLNTLPPQWAQTQNNLAQAYTHLEDWANVAASYSNVLTMYPDDKKAYDTASYLYHEMLFELPRAFMLNQRWLERSPADGAGLSDFAEKHSTTGRFTECEQRITLLLPHPADGPATQITLRAIQIANLLALGNTEQVSGRVDAMVEGITNQSEGFKVDWSFKGTRYFINNTNTLAPYRPWLMQLFDAVEGADRHAILSTLQEIRASFPVEVKR
jgi:tetratricopeptide (TPR) repeat protein